MFKKIILWIIIFVSAGILIIGVLNFYVYVQGEKYAFDSIDALPHAQVAIILGAAVTASGTPSSVLEDRIVTAINLYKKGKVDKILMSGSNPTVADNEVDPVRNVLIANGIPNQDIFLDHAGLDTYSSMYRAKVVFEVDTAIVVTQEFHLPRAIYMLVV